MLLSYEIMGKRRSGRDKEVLAEIERVIESRGYGPTIAELTDALGFSSTAGVHRYVKQLEEQGLVVRDSSKAPLQLAGRRGWQVRCLGQVNAGVPVEALENPEVEDLGDLFNDSEHYCLKVAGDSMIEDAIADGDFVVIRQQKTANNGDTVVAMVNDGEATLKKFFKEKNRFRLQPANSEMEPIYADKVEILGVMVGLIRRT